MQWLIDIILALCETYTDTEVARLKTYTDLADQVNNDYTDQAILDAKIIPPGTIIYWYGLLKDVPDGWAMCDGDNGTPNLIQRFVKGSTDDDNHRNIGGSIYHNHTGESEHHHHLLNGTDFAAGKWKSAQTGAPHEVGNTGDAISFPPYMNLYYIIKL